MLTNKNTSYGFTLIELLVVVSIIALLISILLPALSAARNTARQIQCASNQRQIGIAMQAYANDHDQYTPPAISDTTSIRWPRILVEGGYIHTYLTTVDSNLASHSVAPVTKGVFSCPSESEPSPSSAAWYGTNFGANTYFFRNWKTIPSHNFRQGRFAPFSVKGVSGTMQRIHPDQTAMIGDSDLVSGDSAILYLCPDTITARRIYKAGFRHNQSINVSFFDLHVSALKTNNTLLQTYDNSSWWTSARFQFWKGKNL